MANLRRRSRSPTWRVAVCVLGLLLMPGSAGAAPATSAEQLLDRAYDVQTRDPEAAVALFREALDLAPDNLTARKDLGYLLIELGQPEEALAEFREVLRRAPDDEQTQLQVAYLLDGLGRKHEAYRAFARLRRSADPAVRRTAQLATIHLAGWRWRNEQSRWFTELDLDFWAGSRRDLGVQSLRLATGYRLGGPQAVDVYLSLREYRASGSFIRIVPQPFSEQSTVIALGVRARLFGTPNLLAFVEAGSAVAETAPALKKGDLRGGLAYYDEWRPPVRVPEGTIHPWDRSAELYSELVYFSRFDNNVILFLRHREGRRILETAGAYLDAYLFGQAYADTNGEFSNNFAEFGVGARYYPDKRARWNVWVEGLRGVYLGRRNRDPSLLGPNYGDIRFGVTGFLVF